MKLPPSALVVLAAYVVAITAFGTWLGRKHRGVQDYFLAGRTVPWWAMASCIVATETSTLTFIGVPGKAYLGNWGFLQLVLGYVIGRIVIAAVFLPAYFEGPLFTSYELLQKRFGGGGARHLGGDLPALPHPRRRHPAPRGGARALGRRAASRSGRASSCSASR